MEPVGQGESSILLPNLQISFYYRLHEVRALCLDEALAKAVRQLDMSTLNGELQALVSERHLARVAAAGLRGEVVFPVPCLLAANPFLLAYYRLLYGLSQKEFYNKGPFGRFKCLEERGEIPPRLAGDLPLLCAGLIGTGQLLVDGIDALSLSVVHDLQVLTLGPQFRGSENTRLGQSATKRVFDLIKTIAGGSLKETTERTMRIENAAGRTVLVEFFSDPDARVTEKLQESVRRVLSIEIKGGTDASNIHNRLGEAEKSHQKARNQGFPEFWTIVRVEVDPEVARRESPTTNHFFNLDRIEDLRSRDGREFREMLASRLGIRAAGV